MTGVGGELAAVFQARRITKKVEEESSSTTSGELAAIFQARKKLTHNNHDDDGNPLTPKPRPAAAAAPLTPSSVVVGLSTPEKRKGTKFPLPLLLSPTATPDTSASVIRNKELTAKFESRDLEAGIPTPGFLQDVRKNLKKPGEKKVIEANNPAAVAVATCGASCSDNVKLQPVVQIQEQRDEGEGGLASSSSTRDQSHQDLMAARRSRMVASRSAKSDNSVGFGDDGGGGTSNNTKKAVNDSTSLSINTSTSQAGTPAALNNQKSPEPPVTPSSARREKLRARVRASSHHQLKATSSSQSNVSDEMSASKIYISSPKKDEFEMSFFDANYSGLIPNFDTNGTDQYQQKQTLIQQPHFGLRADSVESIYKDLQATSTGSTVKTANNSSQHSGADDRIVFREHNAITPKVCGSQHLVYEAEEEEKYATEEGVRTHLIARPGGKIRRQSSNGSIEQDSNFSSYALTRSPSQGSQMSAITTPSCFPQDTAVFPSVSSNWAHHEKPILEVDSFGNSASGSTAKSVNDEANLLREQMKELKKKLVEKDAIISQLMKRISDLEQGNFFPGHQQPPPRLSYSMDGAASTFATPNPVILSPKSTKSMSNMGGRYKAERRKSPSNSSSQSVQSFSSTDRKKFAC